MRGRTPSADDTPNRAPPAPPKETTSTDVAGSKTSNGTVEAFCTAKFTSTATVTPTPTTAASTGGTGSKMVASTHTLDDLGVSHPASANNERQQQLQEKHGHMYRSAQTAQDKRSRLSNVINNLRKKVPDTRSAESPRKEEDERDSVERNLETLEKYVMTVLNGVIKDEEDDDVNRKTDNSVVKKSPTNSDGEQQEDSKGVALFEPSKPNESRTEIAVAVDEVKEVKDIKQIEADETDQAGGKEENQSPKESEDFCETSVNEGSLHSEELPVEASKTIPREDKETARNPQESFQDTQEDKKDGRSLGTIIMERLCEHQWSEERGETHSENTELRAICRDLLNDLLNGINQLISEDDSSASECSLEESRDSQASQELSTTSLHCSLPLDKVASVLQNCQSDFPNSQSSSSSTASNQLAKSPVKPPSPSSPVRHLCLYCDRKFLSISLRQRHTERVHQLGGGRRSERNFRKPSQNCQYCSDKCAESLEGLFQHMVGSHGDKYHACVQCSTRYLTREALVGHMSENHSGAAERTSPQSQDKLRETTPCKEFGGQSPREKSELLSPKDRRLDDSESESRSEVTLLKHGGSTVKDSFSNPGSPEFDSSFYSSVSCNIRENLLHHLDGKLQVNSAETKEPKETKESKDSKESKQQSQQSFYEHSVNQIQFPIDISLTAATPVYNKDYASEEYENSSEYAQKPGKSSRSHPRRVSFEKYNFPRKYDGKEQWTCSIKDLSKFDISTQLSLRKKQQLIKERLTLNRLHQIPVPGLCDDVGDDVGQTSLECSPTVKSVDDENRAIEQASGIPPEAGQIVDQSFSSSAQASESSSQSNQNSTGTSLSATEFSTEFGNFLRLRKWDDAGNEQARKQEVIYAELTGEWSRPRIYICGACASRHVTLREMEEHKATLHPNVWCSHFEFSGDQRELYKHLFLPGRSTPTAKARTAILAEKICTKCMKNCNTLAELHRHMLECGGDQTWLLGLFGNGKKKCKWRPFGSRSRRRRQRGMKRNIQNSQTPRVNVAREKQPSGPRVRPSDRESIQKMLANLPPKRATRKVLQDSTLRAQGRLRNVQTRSRPRMVGESSSVSRMSRNKAVLRNKLLKNAKSIQRNRCRSDNISAVIESVVNNCNEHEKKQGSAVGSEDAYVEKNAKENTNLAAKGNVNVEADEKRHKLRGLGVPGKKRNIRTKDGAIRSFDQRDRKADGFKAKSKTTPKNVDSKDDGEARHENTTKTAPKNVKAPKNVERDTENRSPETKFPPATAATGKKVTPTSTPKKKRPVDPVASLNASLKAKSQLRTQDGKFARNPDKQIERPVSKPGPGRPSLKNKNNENAESGMRGKVKVHKTKSSDVQVPRRTTRLSSDSDKMPTLEPVLQIANDEYSEKSTNDLPILSPAASSGNPDQKTRNVRKTSEADETENSVERKTSGNEVKANTAGKTADAEVKNSVQPPQTVEREKRRGRKPKSDIRNIESNVQSSEVAKKRGRKSAPARLILEKEQQKGGSKKVWKNQEDSTGKEDTMKAPETRSNSRARQERRLESTDDINIQTVPIEVKKLLGSVSKKDLLTKLGLTSRNTMSKRSLRQSAPRSKITEKSRLPEDQDSVEDEESTEVPKSLLKKGKFGLRKSPRNVEKRGDKLSKEDDVKSGKSRLKSSNDNPNDKAVSSEDSLPDADRQPKAEEKSEIVVDAKNICDKEQPKCLSSTIVENVDTPSKSSASDEANKNTTFAKRRGRKKASAKLLTADQEESEETKKSEDLKTPKQPEETDTETPGNIDGDLVNLSLSHLHLETANSIDSGKENTLETVASTQKLKVGRPKKTWGSRRERTSKRSLNNVIGILTEGMNIPVEAQQSVVLTVQTSVDNANPDGVLQSNAQPDDNSAAAGNIDRAEKPNEDSNSDVANDADRSEDARDCPKKLQSDQDNESQTENSNLKDLSVSREIAKSQDAEKPMNNADKPHSPTNDIILDLSRRKPKGKGSFLEKIVSKIAKQKDAMLEGEVGSLLDTAADELTSILDEVPALPESANNSVSVEKSPGKQSRGNKESVEEGDGVSIETASKTETAEETLNDFEIPDKLPVEQGTSETRSEICIDQSINSSCKNKSDTKNLDDSGSIEISLQSNLTKVEDKPSMESLYLPNGLQLPITEMPTSTVKSSAAETAVSLAVNDEENTEKTESDDDITRQTERKSKKRSLEVTPTKRNKRKSIEVEEPENAVAEEYHLTEIIKLIEKQRENSATQEVDIQKDKQTEECLRQIDTADEVKPGKRKAATSDFSEGPIHETTTGNVDPDKIQFLTSCDDTIEVKKFKADTAEDRQNRESSNEEVSVRAAVSDSLATNVPDSGVEKTQSKAEETPSLRRSKKKSESKLQETEVTPKRASKRNSLPEGKPSLSPGSPDGPSFEDEKTELSSADEVLPIDVPRRVSSRRKSSNDFSKDIENGENVNLDGIKHNEETRAFVPPATILRVPEVSKIYETTDNEACSKHETVTNASNANVSVSKFNETTETEVTSVPKVPKKRGRKKKSLADEHLLLPDERPDEKLALQGEAVTPEVTKTGTEKVQSEENSTSVKDNRKNEDVSTNFRQCVTETFKVPEVTEVLHTKKRVSKRKSLPDEHVDLSSLTQTLEVDNVITEISKESQVQEVDEKLENVEVQKPRNKRGRPPKKRDETGKIEKSNASASVNVAPTTRTRSSKRKQASNEDLSASVLRDSAFESVDNLSEASCTSESSYFRRKRFSKKRKDQKRSTENVETDVSITDSESTEAEKFKEVNKRETPKRKAKQNISLVDEHLDFESDEATVEIDVKEEMAGVKKSDLSTFGKSSADDAADILEENDIKNEELMLEDSTNESQLGANESDSDVYVRQEDFQAPTKRAGGNFVVVHTKSGEILIVEKRKKLTKEAARFFCHVCTTSFTRKSSLKKHNVSQSHLTQLAKSFRDKGLEYNEGISSSIGEDVSDSNSRNDSSGYNDLNDQSETFAEETEEEVSEKGEKDIVRELSETQSETDDKAQLQTLIDSRVKRQEALEDELLDEEICKITENMSHDEYVLTDHVSPMLPDLTSTPVKHAVRKLEDTKKKKLEKKREKSKKKNLAEEHLALDTPEPERIKVSEISPHTTNAFEADKQNAEISSHEMTEATKDTVRNKSCDIKDQSKAENVKSGEIEDLKVDNIVSDSLQTVQNKRKQEKGKNNEKKKQAQTEHVEHCNDSKPLTEEIWTDIELTNVEDNPNVRPKRHRQRNVEYIGKYTEESDTEDDDIGSQQYVPAKELDSETSVYNDDVNENDTTAYADIQEYIERSDPNEEISSSETKRDVNNTQEQCLENENATCTESPNSEGGPLVTEAINHEPTPNDDRFKRDRSKSKKNRLKKKSEENVECANEIEYSGSDNRKIRKFTKHKRNQNKYALDDTKQSDGPDNEPARSAVNLGHENSATVSISDTQESITSRLSSTTQAHSVPNDSDTTSKHVAVKVSNPPDERIECQESDIRISEMKVCSVEPDRIKESSISEIIPERLPKADMQQNDHDANKSSEDRGAESSHSPQADEEIVTSNFERPLSDILAIDKPLCPDRSQECQEKSAANNGTPEVEKSQKATEFDSDNSSNTNVSNDIQKILHDAAVDDQKKSQVSSEDEGCLYRDTQANIQEKASSNSFDSSDEEETFVADLYSSFDKQVVEDKSAYEEKKTNDSEDPKISGSAHEPDLAKQGLGKKTSRSHRREAHRRSKGRVKSRRSAKKVELSSDSDASDNEDRIESQNKSKIVKSVFGRVFGGEKVDKVKELLNDWVSKSEDDSEASRTADHGKNIKSRDTSEHKSDNERKKKRSGASVKRPGRNFKNAWSESKEQSSVSADEEEHEEQNLGYKLTNSKNTYAEVLSTSRCRQSKKRAEERISRAFVESPVPGEDFDGKGHKSKEASYELRKQSRSDYEESKEELDLVFLEDQEAKRKSSVSRRGRKRSEEVWKDPAEDRQSSSQKYGDDYFSKNRKVPLSLERSGSASSRRSSLGTETVRNHSQSPDRNSQTTQDSEEERDDAVEGRISPLYARDDTPETSIENSSNSEEEKEEADEEEVNEDASRKRSASEFSGEKVVIRSPSLSHRDNRPEVVTIAPTDAIEDNALDVPQEIGTTKPRQGKVLNCDEELFVECCSRLKATTENELRGAKKIKLDHSENYKKDEQPQGYRTSRDRWRDVESQNSLGSLLESVNQLLGEEMYSSRERDYAKRGARNVRSEHSSRSASPDLSRADNVGYEDSLDVAFEHNNKLRDKIQQRMRESEDLIASTFGQKTNTCGNVNYESHQDRKTSEQHIRSYVQHDQLSSSLNREYDNNRVRSMQDEQAKVNLDTTAFKSKMNCALGGLLDKALSNLLHGNGKHDHNGSTPMKVLAELACARAPTSTFEESASQNKSQQLHISSIIKPQLQDLNSSVISKDSHPKKAKNPIKELFERKKEINERRQQERSKVEAALRELNVQRQRKTKKTKKCQEFPLIRRTEHGGLAEKKKRREAFERKQELMPGRIKDVYDFDEEESQIDTGLSVMPYRNRVEKNYEVSCLRTKELDVAGLMSKAIGDSLRNGKAEDAIGIRLESMIDRKFKEIEKFAPKTKGALKAYQSEEQQITGPMDGFVERKHRSKKLEHSVKHLKLKRRSRNSKKKPRNAWYENDSSDEFRTAAKTEDVGVGISKSQRTCSKGKQNLFAELSTSESELEENDKRRRRKKTVKKIEIGDTKVQEWERKYSKDNEDESADEWRDEELKSVDKKNDCENKKSESEMSDQPLVIDERKETNEQKTDDEADNQYDRRFELDDLYREDSSVAASDLDETVNEGQSTRDDQNASNVVQKSSATTDYTDDLIPLEEALNLLDQPTDPKSGKSQKDSDITHTDEVETITESRNASHQNDLTEKCANEQEELEDDIPELPEKLSTNEKPQKEADNLPLHVFLSRKVQESKKRKQQQLKKLQEEQERILIDFQPTRRQRKCAIGKQGLLAEISSSDEEPFTKESYKKGGDKSDNEKARKKRESKEKRKERYIEKKHEQIIAKEQKAIEEEILRELEKKKETMGHDTNDNLNISDSPERLSIKSLENKIAVEDKVAQKKKHQSKEKQKKSVKDGNECLDPADTEKSLSNNDTEDDKFSDSTKQQKQSKSPVKPKRIVKLEGKVMKRNKTPNSDKAKSRPINVSGKDSKERRSSSGKRDSDDEELKTTKSWNKVEEGVGVAIGRRKRAAANQLYYWSSSSDEEEIIEPAAVVEEEEDDRQEQHGWIVGDSHKRMITMLAMEKQLKEKRRRSEDEFEPGRTKNKKHRNSTS